MADLKISQLESLGLLEAVDLANDVFPVAKNFGIDGNRKYTLLDIWLAIKSSDTNPFPQYSTGAVSEPPVIVSNAAWIGTGPYTQEVVATSLTATDKVLVDVDLAGVSYGDIPDYETAYSHIYRAAVGDGVITFYAKEIPAKTLTISILVI